MDSYITTSLSFNMSSRIIELTTEQSVVLGTVTRYRCISAQECAHWTTLTVAQIERAIPVLIRERLIYLDQGGLPKRYVPRPVVAVEEEEDEEIDVDKQYELESSVSESVEV